MSVEGVDHSGSPTAHFPSVPAASCGRTWGNQQTAGGFPHVSFAASASEVMQPETGCNDAPTPHERTTNMGKGRRPLTDAERARVPEDAAAFLAFIRQHGRPGNGNTLTVVRPRARIALALGLTVRQFGRAEAYLAERHVITARWLLPRNEVDAADPCFRWTLPISTERSKT